jgi:TRAP-type mannitol/chloroaromatic compound transport system substrate-binding protein
MPKLALVAASALCVAALGFAATITDATAQERVRWKMQSAFGSQLPHLGASGVRFSKDIERMSGGTARSKVLRAGRAHPAARVLRRGLQGIDRVVLDDARLSHRQVSRARFFTTVPFGPGFGEFLAWKRYGGGNKLRDEIYAKHDLIAIDCFWHRPRTLGLVPHRGSSRSRS